MRIKNKVILNDHDFVSQRTFKLLEAFTHILTGF